jgi:hypothetical protein
MQAWTITNITIEGRAFKVNVWKGPVPKQPQTATAQLALCCRSLPVGAPASRKS